MNLKNILDGWKNYLIDDPVVEEIAKERAAICAGCKFAKEGKIKAIFKDYRIHEIQGRYCDKCPTNIKCPLSAKVRSKNEKCPLDKW